MGVRRDWVSASTFHPLTGEALLAEIEARIRERVRAGRVPLVTFDLDGTLFENRPRTKAILREWIADLDENLDFYGVEEAFLLSGLPASGETYEKALAFWTTEFFSNNYLAFDYAYPGAAEVVRRYYDAGAEIGYLTGRDAPRMGAGTLESLRKHGFVIEGPRVRMLLKPQPEMLDAEHKGAALRGNVELIAHFDNEPHHILAVQAAAPGAMHVYVHTIGSDTPCAPGRDLYYLENFSK